MQKILSVQYDTYIFPSVVAKQSGMGKRKKKSAHKISQESFSETLSWIFDLPFYLFIGDDLTWFLMDS